jgi:hypothetical protein
MDFGSQEAPERRIDDGSVPEVSRHESDQRVSESMVFSTAHGHEHP